MLAEDKQDLLYAFFQDALNAHNLHRIATFVSPDFIFYPRIAGFPNTVDGFRQMMIVQFVQFPDLTYLPNAIDVKGSCARVDWTARASHPCGLIGRKGVTICIGRKLAWNGVTTAQVRNNRIESLWTEQDYDSLREQLDQIPDIQCEN